MFQNENNWQRSQRNKTKKHRNKRSSSSNHKSSERSKYSKAHKQQSHRKLSKIKHMNTISDYVGPERLTKHVGFFTKGKISDSISRIEKIMPKEVKARAKQDLKEVLKLTAKQDLKEVLKLTSVSKKKKCKKKHSCSHHSYSSKQKSVQSSFCTPQYLQHKTGFASNSWKDKLQQSVGLSAVNSVLDSVHEPVFNSSPIEKPQLLARKVLLTSIYPLIKKTNHSLFPKISNQVKLKEKLKLLKNQVSCNGYLSVNSENASCCSSVQENSQISQSVSITNNSVASLSSLTNNTSKGIIKEDFNLNPVFIGENIVQNDIHNIFPPANDFLRNSDLVGGIDFVNIPNEKYNSEINSVIAPSSVGKCSSIVFTHNSPTSSNDSPALKLLPPVKFEAEWPSTPTLYFRHKMF